MPIVKMTRIMVLKEAFLQGPAGLNVTASKAGG